MVQDQIITQTRDFEKRHGLRESNSRYLQSLSSDKSVTSNHTPANHVDNSPVVPSGLSPDFQPPSGTERQLTTSSPANDGALLEKQRRNAEVASGLIRQTPQYQEGHEARLEATNQQGVATKVTRSTTKAPGDKQKPVSCSSAPNGLTICRR